MEKDTPHQIPQQEQSELLFHMTKWHLIIMICTALGTIIEGLIPHSFGTFIAHFRTGLNSSHLVAKADVSFTQASQFELNWLPALSSALPCILLPIFSIVINKLKFHFQALSIVSFILVGFSCILSSLVRKWSLFFFTYCFIYSVGTSLFLAVVIAILTEYFPLTHKRHVLATSLYQIGYPIAALIGNPMSASLIVKYGWRNTLQFIALIQVCIGVIIGICMKPYKKMFCCCKLSTEDPSTEVKGNENENEKSDEIKVQLWKVIRNYHLWTWMVGKYINYMCWYGLRTNVVTYLVKSTNFGLELSASLMSVYAASEISVAIIASLFGDNLRGWLIHVHLIAAASMAILTGIFTIALTSYLSGVILMICIGIAIQFSLSLGFPASAEVLNSEFDMKTGWILTNVAAGLGILTSPLLSGLIMDRFSVTSFFYVQCLGWLLQTIFFGLTIFLINMKKKIISGYEQINDKQ